jgi:hypothetical protein
MEELLGRKSTGSGLENRDYGRGIRRANHATSILSTKVGTKFADKRRPLGRYSSLADTGYEVYLLFVTATKIFLIMMEEEYCNMSDLLSDRKTAF